MPRSPKTSRLEVVDLARGLVIILMALDHVRHLFHAGAYLGSPTDPASTTAAVFATRWVTHLCAPVFLLLAGVSAELRLTASGDKPALSRFLASRGVWLIVLEVAVVNFAVNFNWDGLALQVIWALGVAMIALAALVWLPRAAVLTLAVAVIASHNLLDPLTPANFGVLAPLWVLLHEGGPLPGAPFFILYPVGPWVAVMALGFAIGPLVRGGWAKDRRFALLGAAAFASFLTLRGLNGYGDPIAWSSQATPIRTILSFFNVTKQPPSLDYLLATLGVAAMILPVLTRLPERARSVLSVYGRVPLFFYVAHFFLIHGLMTPLGVAGGYPAEIFASVMSDPSRARMAGWGVSLPVVYGVWIFVLVGLYPACRWFGALKQRRSDWWLSYA